MTSTPDRFLGDLLATAIQIEKMNCWPSFLARWSPGCRWSAKSLAHATVCCRG
jgi:hypothetical protein